MPLESPGLLVDIAQPRPPQARPALFVDRDGTLMTDHGYLSDPSRVTLIESMLPALRAARRAGVPVVVVTNQSGIARGLFGWAAVEAVNASLVRKLADAGCSVAATFACGYYPSADPELDFADHPMRKPQPGMFLRAAELMNIDLARSLVVGDKQGDLLAGARAGLRSGFLLGTDPCDTLPSTFYWRRLASGEDWQRLEHAISAAAPPR